ncbi:MAG: Gfo/Idh/MocA family oxidoreductase [Bacteroidota bacterium]
MNRRNYLKNSLALAGGLAATQLSAFELWKTNSRKRVALVGTGIRGATLWGTNLVRNYAEQVEFVGLCEVNEGRLNTVKEMMGVDCPTFLDHRELLREVKPEWVIVTTVDATHHEVIVSALDAGAHVITEKPLTTDEHKLRAILDAEKRSGKKVLVTFNYRHTPHNTRIKQLLHDQRIGRVTSVDFNWYLNVYHGASYFRRWHGKVAKGGSLWVHKATHHFDLLNWWLDAEPVEVTAYGALEHYGKNGPFRAPNCRSCRHKADCKYYWDITENEFLTNLYTNNEVYDGYLRDGCVYSNDIDIWDKMSAQIRYSNGILVNYSLTTYSPYEGWRIGFNGFDGRIDTWEDIPFQKGEYSAAEQENLHDQEMQQGREETPSEYHEIVVMDNFDANFNSIKVPKYRYGHGGGDRRMLDYLFVNPDAADPLSHMAGTRDGAHSILIGIAARKSIAEGRAVSIEELIDLG